jgi:hypothetical protein
MTKLRLPYIAPLLGLLVAGLTVLSAPAASAYGSHAAYQLGISSNCNNPSICGATGLGGFWGWAEFDNDNTADAVFAGCGHLQRGSNSGYPPPYGGAGHMAADVDGWYIGANGDFILNGTETDTFTGHGQPVTITYDNVNVDTGIPATPGHYSTAEILGFSAPGVTFQVQVTKIPGR